jgi:hypothetical protein
VEIQATVFTDGSRSPVRMSILFGLALAMFHGYLASIHIDHPALYDEMYHMLAAESWRTSGELRILDGEYLRGSLFTKMVALHSNICGPSLECARSMSVAASVLLVFLVTAFAGIAMHPAVGVVAGLLLALNPGLVVVSQYVRFYSLHALVLFVIAAVLFILVAHWRRMSLWQTLGLASLIAALLPFANHLHVLTQVGLLALTFAASIILVPDIANWLRQKRLGVTFFVILTVSAVLAFSLFFVDIESKIQALRSASGWAERHKDDWLFYDHMLRRWYPLLWPMMAVLPILAVAQWPRHSIYFLVAFASSLIVLSVAGTKAERLIVFALPFLFIPMAAGITIGLWLFIGFLQKRIGELFRWPTGRPLVKPLVGAIVIGSLTLFAINEPIARDLARKLTNKESTRLFWAYRTVADWPAAVDELRDTIKHYPVVISSTGVTTAYYLGDFSFELNSSVMRETDTRQEFGLDHRTGRQVISNLESIMKIVRECGSTLVIVEKGHHPNEETLTGLDELVSPLTPAANMRVWTLNPRVIDPSEVDPALIEAEPLNCRPVTRSEAR